MTTLTSDLWDNVLRFTEQNAVVSLAQTSRAMNIHAVKRLYRRIHINQNPRLRSETWYIGNNSTEVSGIRSLAKRSDQNDYIIHLKLRVLQESLEKYGHLVEEFSIYDKVFEENSLELLNEVVSSVEDNCAGITRFFAFDEQLKRPQLASIQNITTDDLQHLSGNNTSMTLKLHEFSEMRVPAHPAFQNLKELIIEDEENASLRILKKLSEAELPKIHLKRLVFNHIHGAHNYNSVLRELSAEYILDSIDLTELDELEMTIGCQEEDCGCLGRFLDSLSPHLRQVHKIALREKTFQRDHYFTEDWDVQVGRFIINIPSKKFKYLSIRHNTPLDGKLLNGLEGNAFRRRRLYETIMPQLSPSIQTFVSPTFIQSCACYEVLTSDLLWNGCECDFCSKFLPLYDKYLMDHAYYDEEETDFRDMISPRLFGLLGEELKKRSIQPYDLDLLQLSPSETYWGFHGYQYVSCFNDVDHCDFDESLFEPLVVCVSHFMREVVKIMVQDMPNLKTVVLSGVYFSIENGEIECVYDKEENIKY